MDKDVKRAIKSLGDALLVAIARDWTGLEEAVLYSKCWGDIFNIGEKLEKDVVNARDVDRHAPETS